MLNSMSTRGHYMIYNFMYICKTLKCIGHAKVRWLAPNCYGLLTLQIPKCNGQSIICRRTIPKYEGLTHQSPMVQGKVTICDITLLLFITSFKIKPKKLKVSLLR